MDCADEAGWRDMEGYQYLKHMLISLRIHNDIMITALAFNAHFGKLFNVTSVAHSFIATFFSYISA